MYDPGAQCSSQYLGKQSLRRRRRSRLQGCTLETVRAACPVPLARSWVRGEAGIGCIARQRVPSGPSLWAELAPALRVGARQVG